MSLSALRAAYSEATPGPLAWGISPAEDELARHADHLSYGAGPSHIVYAPEHPATRIGPDPKNPEHVAVVAVTGNGPTSEANAKFIIEATDAMPAILAAIGAATAWADSSRPENDSPPEEELRIALARLPR